MYFAVNQKTLILHQSVTNIMAILTNIKESISELLDELMTFITLLAAVLIGLYYSSWPIFIGILITGFIIATLINQALKANRN